MDQVRLAVVGSGYVGTTVAACLAAVGHSVIGVECDPGKLQILLSGRAPFHEPGLDELLQRGVAEGRLDFTDSIPDALSTSEVVFICVGAPAAGDGRPDLHSLDVTARTIGSALEDQVVVNKSTIPIGGLDWLGSVLRAARGGTRPVPLVSNPEFLSEGTAVRDLLHPARIVLGSENDRATEVVVGVLRPILEQSFPGGNPFSRPILLRTSPQTAELIKYASNAFLATKVSFVNEIANVCDRLDADIDTVALGMGLDPRIGIDHLRAGFGWGGSCLSKDLAELIATAEEHRYEPQLLRATADVNRRQRKVIFEKLKRHFKVLFGRRVCLLGLSFKPGTDDLRDAPALEIAAGLVEQGAVVTAFDPVVTKTPQVPDLVISADPYRAAEGTDVIVLVTEWPDFAGLDYRRLRRAMRSDVFIDGRNMLDPVAMEEAGFRYERIGGYGTDEREILVNVPDQPGKTIPFGRSAGATNA